MIVQFAHTKIYRLSSEAYKSVKEATENKKLLENNCIKSELLKTVDSTYLLHIGDFLFEDDANKLSEIISNHFIPTNVRRMPVSQKIIDSYIRVGSYVLINRRNKVAKDIDFDKKYQIVSIVGDDYNVMVNDKIITFQKSDLIKKIKKTK